MKKTLFIADLHLSDNRPDITQCFIHFLSSIDTKNTDKLFILGDLFEAWVGDDDDNQFTRTVANAIKSVREQGVPVFFIHGNRDFLIRQQYAHQCGMELLPEQQVIDLYGTPTLILHGDELCTRDVAYQKFRKKARGWWWPRLVLWLPLKKRKEIAQKGRETSKKNQQALSADIMDVTPEEVLNYLDKFAVKQMIHGHTHRPAIHNITTHNGEAAKRIVVGDWYEQGSVLTVTKEGMTLANLPFQEVTDHPA
ncbi:UDP-2,3-diacylglucosamine diphosphatase [Planctobacterium marinum]|uniref:UDP-2,3-diacylglucosamine hydrolase n=1 Tax=Planctobacterium marinum TaxID=1631968 RepID=A0AA48HUN3_9ALTE|nr:UDP-2,3-diacylglucosamine hydrolase [Planctobacterium marinum]